MQIFVMFNAMSSWFVSFFVCFLFEWDWTKDSDAFYRALKYCGEMVKKQCKQKRIISLFHVMQNKLPGRNILFLCIMKSVSVFKKKKS